MGFFETIYIVHLQDIKNQTNATAWYWDRTDAEQNYENAVSTHEDNGSESVVTLYSTDITGLVGDYVDEALGNNPDSLNEIRSNRKAPEGEDVTWTELEFRADGTFYIERLKSPDYWPYRVERYNEDQWRVFDATTMTPIAVISPRTVGSNETFRVVVNGYSQTKSFTNLKGAVIYAAEEYNGV